MSAKARTITRGKWRVRFTPGGFSFTLSKFGPLDRWHREAWVSLPDYLGAIAERRASTDLLDLAAEVRRLDDAERERQRRSLRAIEDAADELVAEFTVAHGREPNLTEKVALTQEATAEVRSAQEKQDIRDADEGK